MPRFFVALLLLLVVVLGAPTYAAGASASPDHVTLSWTADPATTMTVTWRTDTSVTTGTVEFSNSDARVPKAAAAAVAHDFTTDLGTVCLFTATLTGLTAHTRYTYRVGGGAQWSDAHTFTTADPRTHDVKFLVFGDSQSSPTGTAPYGLWRTTVHNAYAANPDARFMVNVGDLVDTGQSGAHWEAWFAALAGVGESLPVMPVVGNHETYGQPGSGKPSYWLAQFTLPQNGPAGLKGQVYSYTYGPVHCAVLDSQQDEEKAAGDIFTPQKRWLDADLTASKTPWTFAFFHKTPYDIKADRANPTVKAAFCPVLEQHHVDIVFNGHDHGIARTFPMHDGAAMARPAQGTVYYIAGRSGGKTYADLQKKPWNTFFYNPLDQPDYLVVEVKGQTLTVKAVKQDGTLLDLYREDKTTDRSTDSQATPAAVGTN